MATSWVVNASPLILLGKVGRLDLLVQLADRILVPAAVAAEVSAKADGAATLEVVRSSARCTLVEDQTVVAPILAWDLGAGETQVVSTALAIGAERVVLDDLEARRCAKAMGLRIIGTLGIVGRAKASGKLNAAAPVIDQLRRQGLYARDEIVRELLRQVGEAADW